MPPASLPPPSGNWTPLVFWPIPFWVHGFEGKLTPSLVPGVGGWLTPRQSSTILWPKPWREPSPRPGSELGEPRPGAAGGHLATLGTHREKPRGWMEIMGPEDIREHIDQAMPETHRWTFLRCEPINSLFWRKPFWARLPVTCYGRSSD